MFDFVAVWNQLNFINYISTFCTVLPKSERYMRNLFQKQLSQAGISNYILQFTVGCNCLSLPEIPTSGHKSTYIFGIIAPEPSSIIGEPDLASSVWERNQGPINSLRQSDASICWWISSPLVYVMTLQWRHNEHDGISNHQPRDCLFNHSFRRRSKKTSKLHVTGLCVGEFTGERWIPLTKGQLRGKCFHLMTSSWIFGLFSTSASSQPLLANFDWTLGRKHISMKLPSKYKFYTRKYIWKYFLQVGIHFVLASNSTSTPPSHSR